MSVRPTTVRLGSTILFALSGSMLISVGRAEPAAAQEYSTCKTWQEVVERNDLQSSHVIRVSDPGTKEKPSYAGFWFFDRPQFVESGRYALAMKVDFQNRDVTAIDSGEIGYFDLQDNNKWTKIGQTMAWNWQQGCRLG